MSPSVGALWFPVQCFMDASVVCLFAFGSEHAPSWGAYVVEPGPAHPASQDILLAGFHQETLARSWRGKDREALSCYPFQVPVVPLEEIVAFL